MRDIELRNRGGQRPFAAECARVVAIEPGGVIMRKLGENADKVCLTLSGFSLKVKLAVASGEGYSAVRRGCGDQPR